MIKYARLTLQLREVIENMHADGYVQEAIAAAVGVDQSTVSPGAPSPARGLRRPSVPRPGAVTVADPHDSPAAGQERRAATAPGQSDAQQVLDRAVAEAHRGQAPAPADDQPAGASATSSTPATPTTGDSSEAS